MEQYLFHFWIVVWNTRHNFCLTNYVCDLALAFEWAVRFLYAVTAFCLCLYLTQHRLFMCVDYWLLHIFIFIWGSTHAKVSFSKVAMEICWYHSCVRTLVNLVHFCSTSFFERKIWGDCFCVINSRLWFTNKAHITNNFVFHCWIWKHWGCYNNWSHGPIFLDTTVLCCLRFFNSKLTENCDGILNP